MMTLRVDYVKLIEFEPIIDTLESELFEATMGLELPDWWITPYERELYETAFAEISTRLARLRMAYEASNDE